MNEDTKDVCRKRLTKVEGQVRGIARMIDEGRYCIDVLTQLAAVRAALRKVEEAVLKDHIQHCVAHAMASGSETEQSQKIAELMDVIERAQR
ncbi:MAG: metal-sensitive transcriptional regulator [Hyphomicrobium sp.]|nr:metal-sensitive transcriptional regulator [Hyphomicrobium sp.]